MNILRIIKLKEPKVDFSSPVTSNKVLYRIILNTNKNKKFKRIKIGKRTLCISSDYTPCISTYFVWINPHYNYLGIDSKAKNPINNIQIQDLVKKFNKEYVPCCNKIRLCKKCLLEARKLVSF